jgi:hypothetical protein
MIRAVATACLLGLAACQATVTLPAYTPVTTREFAGTLSVADFTYTPPGRTAQNEIRENAVGNVFVTEPVGTYFANAVRRELRQAGISLRGGPCTLTGQVHDFATESLGFEVTYITDATYRLIGPAEQSLLERQFRVSFKTSKFIDATLYLGSVNKAVADNIAQLLADPSFRAALDGPCAPPPPAPAAPRRAAPRV